MKNRGTDWREFRRIKQAIRDEYAWPGGYPLFLVTSDGAALSINAARQEWRRIVQAHLWGDVASGWHIAGPDVTGEDSELECAHTGAKIESAYGAD